MDAQQITRQMMQFNKAVIDNSYVGMTVMQGYSENMLDGFLRQFPWITDENKKPLIDSFQCIRQTGEKFKEAVDRSFASLDKMVDK